MHVLANAGRQGRPPLSSTPPVLNVLVGDIEAGRAYFTAKWPEIRVAIIGTDTSHVTAFTKLLVLPPLG